MPFPNTRKVNQRATTSNFRSPQRTLPSARQRQELTDEKIPAPSYAHANRQRGSADVEEEEKDKEDEKIKANAGKDKEDKGQSKTDGFTPKTNKDSKNEPSTQPSTTEDVQTDDVYNMFWSIEADNAFEDEIYETPSYWTPNFFAIREALKVSSIFSRENHIMLKTSPEYVEYAVYCYYAVLFYIQILRAQRDSGFISGTDSSFLRRFERKYAPEELPIVGFLLPHYSAIAATLPEDGRHSWVIPQYGAVIENANFGKFNDLLMKHVPATGAGRTLVPEHMSPQKLSDYHTTTGVILLQPAVPFMLAILRTFIERSSQQFTTATARRLYGADYDDLDYPFWTELDQLQPISLATKKSDGTRDAIQTKRFGQQLTLDGTTQNDKFAQLIASPGLDIPFEADASGIEIASKHWQRTSFYTNIQVFAVNTNPTAAPADGDAIRHNETRGEDPDFKNLEDFLLMPKSSNLDWFDVLVSNAVTHSRYYRDVKSLNDVSTTTGMSPLLLADFKDISGGRFGQTTKADAALNTINRTLSEDWFHPIIKTPGAQFWTSRAAIDRSEELQALAFATNATIPFTITSGRIGEGLEFRSGSIFTEDKLVRKTAHRSTTHAAKKMFNKWNVMLQTQSALPRPTGY